MRPLPSVIHPVLIERWLCVMVFQGLGIQLRLDGYISTLHRSQSGWRVEQETDTNTKNGKVRDILNQVVVSVDQYIKLGKEMGRVGGW